MLCCFQTSTLLPGYIPEPPTPPSLSGGSVDDLIVQQLNALGEPALQSLGLATWWPWGIVQSMLEQLHVGLNVPWWASIVIGRLTFNYIIYIVLFFFY